MGVDILYFADHDLPMDSADIFMKEFSNRVNGNVEIYDWNYESFEEKNGKWYVSYKGNDGTFESYFQSGHYFFCRRSAGPGAFSDERSRRHF